MRLLPLLALLAMGCATVPAAPRAWSVEGHLPEEFGPQSLALVEAARRVLPDAKGYLAAGGQIVWHSEGLDALAGRCIVPPGRLPSGCSSPGRIDVLFWPWAPPEHAPVGPEGLRVADIARTALAHELAHLGLATGGGYSGPVDGVSEERAEAGGLLIVKEWRRTRP